MAEPIPKSTLCMRDNQICLKEYPLDFFVPMAKLTSDGLERFGESVVKRWNNHDALVEALKAVIEGMSKNAVQNCGDWQSGLFCGLEDQGITDRYDACLYGYAKALERVEEWAIGDISEVLVQLKEQDKEPPPAAVHDEDARR